MKRAYKIALMGCFAAAVLSVGAFWYHTQNKVAGCRAEDFSPWTAVESAHTIGTGDTQEKRVFLTFDDGPSELTESVLDILKEKQVTASFFVIAAEGNEPYLPLLQRTQQEGHTVALHTCSHDYKQIYTSTAAFWQDIDQLKEKISPYLVNQPVWLRFPGGSTNTVSHKYGGSGLMEKLEQQATEKGYQVLDWNVSAEDSVGKKATPDAILQRIIKDSEGKNTCVVLMHDSKINKTTVQALPDIIEWYQQQGYRFCTLSQETP